MFIYTNVRSRSRTCRPKSDKSVGDPVRHSFYHPSAIYVSISYNNALFATYSSAQLLLAGSRLLFSTVWLSFSSIPSLFLFFLVLFVLITFIHQLYLNPCLICLISSQMVAAIVYKFRNIHLDRSLMRFSPPSSPVPDQCLHCPTRSALWLSVPSSRRSAHHSPASHSACPALSPCSTGLLPCPDQITPPAAGAAGSTRSSDTYSSNSSQSSINTFSATTTIPHAPPPRPPPRCRPKSCATIDDATLNPKPVNPPPLPAHRPNAGSLPDSEPSQPRISNRLSQQPPPKQDSPAERKSLGSSKLPPPPTRTIALGDKLPPARRHAGSASRPPFSRSTTSRAPPPAIRCRIPADHRSARR